MGISEGCFVLSLRLITFGGRSANLAYLVHKRGRKTSIIIYHLMQNTWINIHSLGLIHMYQKNDDVTLFCGMLDAFAF